MLPEKIYEDETCQSIQPTTAAGCNSLPACLVGNTQCGGWVALNMCSCLGRAGVPGGVALWGAPSSLLPILPEDPPLCPRRGRQIGPRFFPLRFFPPSKMGKTTPKERLPHFGQ